ncbi:WASH complex subunit 3 [Sitophilus oryzae]|uniref:WASH complex subunit 3 n=1 Tax=Sitophilus oryzae TaxID=7048 RepID=A0A6J2YJN1_SITOR|nr:WASH complex subunit 3 [Sitophilus oryzae]
MTMQDEELTAVNANVDYKEILPIQQKRTIAFVNHFLMNTVSYLNNFAQSCESRFMEFEYKIQKIEASLLILEAQLSSIPGLETKTVLPENDLNEVGSTNETNKINQENIDNDKGPASSEVDTNPVITENQSEVTTDAIKICDDPRFAKFFKLLHVGVPAQAVKLKMQTEGLDPTLLDNPDALAPESSIEPEGT